MADRRRGILESEARAQSLRRSAATVREMKAREHALEIASAQASEELDEVKSMNSEVIGARVRTLRDAQLLQKRAIATSEKAAAAEMARTLEIGRVRAVALYAEREAALKSQRMKGQTLLLAQIKEHREAAEGEHEVRLREKEAMAAADRTRRSEDSALEIEKQRRQHEFLADCVAANDVTFRRQMRDREREIEDARAVAEFQAEQAARAEQREREVAEAKAQREREIAEIRRRQQKMIDTQAQLDELRARRVQEEIERREREKEREAIEKHQQIGAEMRQDRIDSINTREKRLLEMARLEKREFRQTVRAQEEAQEKARMEYEAKKAAGERYRKELKDELDAREEERRMRPLRNLDETKHLQEMNEDYVEKLEQIRQSKIRQLTSEGVPDKYLADLRKKRFVLQ
jgi:hypothetical protein